MKKSAMQKYAEATNNSGYSRILQERQNKFFESREREKLIEEITQRVLSRISLKMNSKDALKQTETLRKELDKLFTGG